MHNPFAPNGGFPHHVSDRADRLISALDEAQQKKLWKLLAATTVDEWWEWLQNNRAVISQYAHKTPSGQAAHRNAKREEERDLALLAHYACVALALVSARMEFEYLQLPPSAALIGTEADREILVLNAWTAFSRHCLDGLWPFEWTDDQNPHALFGGC